jgi:hypothetical protein
VPTAQHTSTYSNGAALERRDARQVRSAATAAKIPNHNSFSNPCTDFAHGCAGLQSATLNHSQ